MLSKWVKTKMDKPIRIFLILFAISSFLASWGGLFRPSFVENWYSAGIYPWLSRMIALPGNVISISWLDLVVIVVVPLIIWFLYRGELLNILSLVAVGYLFFFWTWGLNYHREPLISKLEFDENLLTLDRVEDFTLEAADQLNRLYLDKEALNYNVDLFHRILDKRVVQVVEVLDGTFWKANKRIKSSKILDLFFQAADVDGMFNPFGHEALVASGLLQFELPMTIAHEMAHVRGYSNEGDANFIALMACVNARDPMVRYSGWLLLWQYLRSDKTDELLDMGPRKDLEEIFNRRRDRRVNWLAKIQLNILDMLLKTNRVEGGIASYGRIVVLAVGTEPSWKRFAEQDP